MSQIADLTVFDGAVSPVSHVLVAESVSRVGTTITCVWREKLATIPDEAQVYAILKIETLKSGVKVVTFETGVPVMESISGVNSSGYTAAPKVAYVDKDVHVKYVHPRSTITSRQNCTQISRNILNNVSVTTPAVTAGVLADALHRGLTPT